MEKKTDNFNIYNFNKGRETVKKQTLRELKELALKGLSDPTSIVNATIGDEHYVLEGEKAANFLMGVAAAFLTLSDDAEINVMNPAIARAIPINMIEC